jgi:opacity protein-like surface antigen
MRRYISGKLVIIFTLFGILGSSPLLAADFDFAQFNRECGLRFAYGKSTRKADVKLYSLLPRWGIFLVRPGHSYLAGIGLSFVIEGTVSIADAEDTGWELGLAPLLKLSLPLGDKVLFFIEGGAGIIWENFDSPAVAHTFNFTPQVGGGVDIALTRKLALSLAYRFRHASNAGLFDKNSAFNVNLFQIGLLYYH